MKKYVILLVTIFLGLASLSYAQAPVPFINLPLIPDATAPGGADFTLTVNGTGFVSTSVVNWNGTALATQFVNQSQLTATVPAANIATASTGWVTVVSPAPGGGTSNTAFFTAATSTKYIAFTLASSPAVGSGPDSAAVGDFNGDGKLDLAVSNYCGSDATCQSGTVSILLGDGTGNFTLASSPAVGSVPWSVAVGDFNGDGKLDLAVGSKDGASVLLGDGTGNFTLAWSLATGDYLPSVVVGDFNRDGKLDLAVGDLVLLGDGTGSFTPVSSLPAAGPMAVGDFNGDGNLDLAVASGNAVFILLGDGTGNFALVSSQAVGIEPYSVAVGDFNGDGKPDLAVANNCGSDPTCQSAGTLSILLGDGTGNFTLATSPTVGDGPRSVAVGDFNGDGKLDLAVANNGSFSASVLLGDGSGNFTLASSPGADESPQSVAVGDFNGDGKPDLAVADFSSGTVSVLLQVPAAPAVTLSPTNLTFGTQLFGTGSSPQPVTLTNTGNAPLNISKVVTSPNFSQTNSCSRKLQPGGQCTANVVFTPHNVNTITGTITITDNAPNSPQTVQLTGVGTAVTLLPSSLDFGSQPVGTTSQPQTVTFTNYAPRAVTISGGGLTGTDAGSFALSNNTCGGSVPAGGNCTISVTFTPKGKGQRTATLKVEDNGGASPQTVALSGTGT
jgi:hypothetical protein